MEERKDIPGRVTVEPEVLETIARLTAVNVPGVVRVAEKDVDRFLGITGKSVVVQVREGRVSVELHLIAGPDQSLLRLGREVQHEVTRSIQQMIGMPVEAVNIHIEDVVYAETEMESAPASA
ncbi:MAG: Asp23/Gls24 family envelope stress response protein [Anaerolineae bacterium]|nr:Asp23/Gls24 family envelope stress response protein [Anaerolineae bacterium]